MLLFARCLLLLPLFVGFCVCSLFCCAVLGVLFSFVIILLRKRKLVALVYLSSRCLVAVSVLCDPQCVSGRNTPKQQLRKLHVSLDFSDATSGNAANRFVTLRTSP